MDVELCFASGRNAPPTRGSGDDDDADDDLYPILDLNQSTFAVVLVEEGVRAAKDTCVFRLKVGQTNSPLLHLVRVLECDPEMNRVEWQWYRPHNNAFEVPATRRMSKEKCTEAGAFVRGAERFRAWSLYDMDEDGVEDVEDCDDIITDGDLLVAWDIDREEEARG